MTGTERTAGSPFDWSTTTPSTAAVETLAEESGTDVIDIPPLYNTIDPDALDSLFGPETAEDAIEVSFIHFGYHVAIAADGRVNVQEVESAV